MTKFGLLWKDGRALRSVAQQKDWLSDEGVEPAKMDFECPPGRDGAETIACFIETFGYDKENWRRRSVRFAIDDYVRYTRDGSSITILEYDKTFSGLDGCREFLHLWLDRFNKKQTGPARLAKRRKPKIKFPKFYLALSAEQKKQFKKDFEGQTYTSVDAMAHAYGTSRISIYRVTRKLNLTRPRLET